MLKSLVAKELRETAAAAALGLAFYFFITAKAMRHDLLPWFSWDSYAAFYEIPFVGQGYLASFTVVSAGLAIVLGLVQSLREDVYGTWPYLLYRAAGRARLIGIKLLTGLGVLLACGAAAILLYAWWAATPGTHASPFAWSMTTPVWKVWLTMPIVYLGAFFTGIRPARWKGTRLLPLAAAGSAAVIIPDLRWWPICGLGLLLLAGAVLLTGIFFVARTRDF